MHKYKATCITECQFRGIRWPVGKVYEGDVEPPRHFLIERRPEAEVSAVADEITEQLEVVASEPDTPIAGEEEQLKDTPPKKGGRPKKQ